MLPEVVADYPTPGPADARALPLQYTTPPSPTNASAPPTTFAQNANGFASPSGGTVAITMASTVIANPLTPAAHAPGRPPGTRTVSGVGASRRSRRNEMNR